MNYTFENPENWPEDLKAILNNLDPDLEGDYNYIEEVKGQCEEIGFTFEYGLDGVPYNLKKI